MPAGRMTPSGPRVDEHIFTYWGNPDPGFSSAGGLGIIVVCTCGVVRQLEGGHTDLELIRLKCNEVGVT